MLLSERARPADDREVVSVSSEAGPDAKAGSAASPDTATPDALPVHVGGNSGATLMLIAVLLSAGAIWFAQVILIPLVLGTLCSYALDPLQRRVVNWGVPRGVAAALVLSVAVGGVGFSAFALRHQAAAFVAQLPAITQKLRVLVRDGDGSRSGAVVQVQQAAAELKKAADQSASQPARGVTRVQVEQPVFELTDLIWRGSVGVIGFAGQATIVLFLVYYLLASGDLYKRKLVKITGPSLGRRRVTVEILNQITAQIERFLVARVVVSLTVGGATWLAFWAMGVAQPAMWGIAAGVLNTIPYVGPSIVAVAAGVAGLLQFNTAEMAATVAGVAVLIAVVEGMVVTPWLMGKASEMNAPAVFVGLSFWGWIWGIWGLLLAVPIMMAVKAVCEHVDGWTPVSDLLGE